MWVQYVKSDLCRYVGREKLSTFNFFKNYFRNDSFRFCFWLRIAKFSKNPILRKWAKHQHHKFKRKFMLDIPIETNIGYGLYIGHGRSVVINPTTKIGNNVNLSQFTTIGANHGQAAIIGDNVYIGPNVCIVEDVTIGNNVKVGAGAVVTKMAPENTTIAGVPAKVINVNTEPNRYINRRWSLD